MEMIRYIFVYLLSILAFHYGFETNKFKNHEVKCSEGSARRIVRCTHRVCRFMRLWNWIHFMATENVNWRISEPEHFNQTNKFSELQMGNIPSKRGSWSIDQCTWHGSSTFQSLHISFVICGCERKKVIE